MNQKVDLKLDWCSHEAAKYACENWHYSKRMYVNKTVKIGVWEDNKFIGCIIYGTGCQFIGSPYNLDVTEVCELVRVALASHKTPVSRILAISIKFLKNHCPDLKLIVSFSDTSQGHHGGIYQATNWIFVGSKEYHEYEVLGKRVPPRTLHHRYGKGGQSIPWLRSNIDPNAKKINNGIKHKYLFPLTPEMREKILPLSKPYPKRDK